MLFIFHNMRSELNDAALPGQPLRTAIKARDPFASGGFQIFPVLSEHFSSTKRQSGERQTIAPVKPCVTIDAWAQTMNICCKV